MDAENEGTTMAATSLPFHLSPTPRRSLSSGSVDTKNRHSSLKRRISLSKETRFPAIRSSTSRPSRPV